MTTASLISQSLSNLNIGITNIASAITVKHPDTTVNANLLAAATKLTSGTTEYKTNSFTILISGINAIVVNTVSGTASIKTIAAQTHSLSEVGSAVVSGTTYLLYGLNSEVHHGN